MSRGVPGALIVRVAAVHHVPGVLEGMRTALETAADSPALEALRTRYGLHLRVHYWDYVEVFWTGRVDQSSRRWVERG